MQSSLVGSDCRHIRRHTDLSAHPRCRAVAASEHTQTHAQSWSDEILYAGERLQLRTIRAGTVRDPAVEFDAERDARAHIMQHGEATRINLPTTCLNANRAGAGVAGNQAPDVNVAASAVRQRLLSNDVQPVVGETRSQSLACAAGGKLDEQNCCKRGQMGPLWCLAESVFCTQIRVSDPM